MPRFVPAALLLLWADRASEGAAAGGPEPQTGARQSGIARPLAGAQPGGGLATSSYSLEEGTSLEDPSYSEREDAEDGAASQETTPAPARRAVLVKPRALPPQPPRPWSGAVRQDAEKPQHAYGILRLCFLGVTLSWRPWRWAGQGRPSSPEGPSIPGDSERTRTWAASGHCTLADLAPFP